MDNKTSSIIEETKKIQIKRCSPGDDGIWMLKPMKDKTVRLGDGPGRGRKG